MPDDRPNPISIDAVRIDHAVDDDRSQLWELFRHGVVEGLVPDNDTGADIENLVQAYFSDEGQSAFWVARLDKLVIGMVGVQCIGTNQAEVRRLRVRDGYRRQGVGSKLMREALAFCRHHGYLKVRLDVRIERGPAIALFENFGFRLGRTREIDGRKLLDFLLDLYTETPGRPE